MAWTAMLQPNPFAAGAFTAPTLRSPCIHHSHSPGGLPSCIHSTTPAGQAQPVAHNPQSYSKPLPLSARTTSVMSLAYKKIYPGTHAYMQGMIPPVLAATGTRKRCRCDAHQLQVRLLLLLLGFA
jgi:hypothetical protein